MSRGRRQTEPKKVTMAVRRARCIQLRISGLTYEQIGGQLGISNVAAYKHVRAGLEAAAKSCAENIDGVREQELCWLDRALTVVMSVLAKPDALASDRLAAVDRLVKIQERRARYLGLDKPEQYEHAGAGGGSLFTPVIMLPPEDPRDDELPVLEAHAEVLESALESAVVAVGAANGSSGRR